MTDIAVAATTPRRTSRRRRGTNWFVVVSLMILGLIAFLAVFGRTIAPYDPLKQNLALGLSTPSPEHWLGTDKLGRDVYSRVLAGTNTAVIGPLVIAFGSMLIGNALGLFAGYRGNRTDAMIMRWVDLMFSLPGTLVVIVIAGAFGGGYWLAVAVLVVLTVPVDARIIRTATIEQVPRPYVEAAKSIGVSDRRIMLMHIWPNVAPVAIANSSLMFAGSLVALAGLSFLGLGVSPGTPDWGLMVSEGRNILFVNPVSVLAPAFMIVVTATTVSVVGDWAYERLSSRGATR